MSKSTWRQATEEENRIIRELLIDDMQYTPKSLKDYITGAKIIFLLIMFVCTFSAVLFFKNKYYIPGIMSLGICIWAAKFIIESIIDRRKQAQTCENIQITEFTIKDVVITKITTRPNGLEPSRMEYSVKIKDDSKQIKRSYKLLTKDVCELGPALLVDTKFQRYNGGRVVIYQKNL